MDIQILYIHYSDSHRIPGHQNMSSFIGKEIYTEYIGLNLLILVTEDKITNVLGHKIIEIWIIVYYKRI